MRPISGRTVLRSASYAAPAFAPARNTLGKRFASTSPANARRTWKSSALRWGIAITGLYYYNTSPVFAEQPQHNLLNPNTNALDDDNNEHPTLEALTTRRGERQQQPASKIHSAIDDMSKENASTIAMDGQESPIDTEAAGDLEEEAAGEGAFNPETGEINWDCPCLGGMAHGPCGPEFREAFSCFVFSTEEPKGMDCIDKFQNMQTCFQAHPEVYKGELEDDEELDAGLEQEKQELLGEIAARKKQDAEPAASHRILEEPDTTSKSTSSTPKSAKQRSPVSSRLQSDMVTEDQEAQTQVARTTQPESLPTASFDARDANQNGNSKPAEEAKVKASHDETHKSTMSPDREKITQGQKSGVTSNDKKSTS